MLLEELFTDLSHGQLSNLSISMDGGGTIKEEARPKIIRYLNEGLIRLYSRFQLKQNEVIVQMFSHITNYHLLKKYALSQQEPEAEGYFYIRDLIGEPFEEDVIKIMAVRDSLYRPMVLNDRNNPMSVFTPQADVLQVPEPIEGMALSVIYQAKHRKIALDANTTDEATGSFWVPDVLYGALSSFIAYSVYRDMNTQESAANANNHLVMYEALCAEAEDKDLVNSSIATTNTKFEQRGFI
jgi:hypothetical protein